ncbi:head GIN domain-containing protein [Piscinibacter terrae]|nr:head GIN domain-containing protein [Albitalea terrae]
MLALAYFTPRRYILGAFAAAMVASGAAVADEKGSWSERSWGPMVKGSGQVVTEARQVSGYQGVHLKGSMKIVLRQSGREGVQVEADDNLIGLIETAVTTRDGLPTLEIGTKKGASYTTRNRMTVTVDLIDLQSVAISGSGDVLGNGIKSGELRLSIVGSGDVRLTQLATGTMAVNVSGSGDVALGGKADKLSVSIAGSGDVVTRELQAEEVSVSIAGSGDAKVNARKTLNVSIAGSGDVDYTGDPVLKTSIAGHGNVKKR